MKAITVGARHGDAYGAITVTLALVGCPPEVIARAGAEPGSRVEDDARDRRLGDGRKHRAGDELVGLCRGPV